MDEPAEKQSQCADRATSPRRRLLQPDQDPPDRMLSAPPSQFYEELFCNAGASNCAVPLAGSLISFSKPQSDVVKQGYLGKQEHSHRRYFVLRADGRLEWYKNQEKFTAGEKAAGEAALFSSNKQGVIYLRSCLGVSWSGSSRRGHAVVLYAKDQTVVLVAEHWQEQEEWYLAIKTQMEEERRDAEPGEGLDEEDDGYCTLPPAASFKEVWPVTVRPRGLGSSKALAGETRLCLTNTCLVLVRVSTCNDLRSVTIPLLSVRRFGHLDGSFFVELGRSAPNGPGEIWMEARDQGNLAVAQHIHEVVRETVRALRALPDFSWSPTSTQNSLQNLLASKRCRPKCREKLVRPLSSRPRNPDSQPHPEPCRPSGPEPESPRSSSSQLSPIRPAQSSCSQPDGYMEMKTNRHPPEGKEKGTDCTAAGCGSQSWEPSQDEEEEEGLGYMMMSPHSSPVLHQDDYMTMASPVKQDWPGFFSPPASLHSSFNSSSSTPDRSSPLQPSYQEPGRYSLPPWLLTPVHKPEPASSSNYHPPAPAWTTTVSPLRSVGGSDGTSAASPVKPGTGSVRARTPSECSAGRSRLSWCLPACLRSEDTS